MSEEASSKRRKVSMSSSSSASAVDADAAESLDRAVDRMIAETHPRVWFILQKWSRELGLPVELVAYIFDFVRPAMFVSQVVLPKNAMLGALPLPIVPVSDAAFVAPTSMYDVRELAGIHRRWSDNYLVRFQRDDDGRQGNGVPRYIDVHSDKLQYQYLYPLALDATGTALLVGIADGAYIGTHSVFVMDLATGEQLVEPVHLHNGRGRRESLALRERFEAGAGAVIGLCSGSPDVMWFSFDRQHIGEPEVAAMQSYTAGAGWDRQFVLPFFAADGTPHFLFVDRQDRLCLLAISDESINSWCLVWRSADDLYPADPWQWHCQASSSPSFSYAAYYDPATGALQVLGVDRARNPETNAPDSMKYRIIGFSANVKDSPQMELFHCTRAEIPISAPIRSRVTYLPHLNAFAAVLDCERVDLVHRVTGERSEYWRLHEDTPGFLSLSHDRSWEGLVKRPIIVTADGVVHTWLSWQYGRTPAGLPLPLTTRVVYRPVSHNAHINFYRAHPVQVDGGNAEGDDEKEE